MGANCWENRDKSKNDLLLNMEVNGSSNQLFKLTEFHSELFHDNGKHFKTNI